MPETEIAVFRQTLASSKADKLKSYDLVWLLHLVGDVHQPLHSSTRVSSADLQGDSGGNNVKLSDPSKELHAFWDGLPGDSSNVADVITYGKTLTAADPLLAQKAAAADWIKESFDIAETTVYSSPIGADRWAVYRLHRHTRTTPRRSRLKEWSLQASAWPTSSITNSNSSGALAVHVQLVALAAVCARELNDFRDHVRIRAAGFFCRHKKF